ncbi:PAS domain-containing sensor histidine kinase [Desulfurispira natronophila]|uniref:histidine kinase n=1 Tax=Desulfurispira natronophila TaxID=682562 RepID=A0A7W7Y4R1_9BACT|nr:PAS domain-containing sensor histidine kinase [Desulfurispira natronophila]MBB5021994.1 PAS domain S-box-containing protein [Desulfurispira natronophila]
MGKVFALVSLLLLLFLTAYADEPTSLYQQMFKNHGVIMLLIDPDTGKIVDANQAAADFYGYDREHLVTLSIDDINTLSSNQIQQEMQLAIAQDRNHFHFRHRLSHGDIRHVKVYSCPITLNQQTLLFSIIHDISQQRKAEAKAQHYQDNLESLVEKRTSELSRLQNIFIATLAGALGVQTAGMVLLVRNILQRRRVQRELELTLQSQQETIDQAILSARRKDTVIVRQERRQAQVEMLVNMAHQWRQPLNVVSMCIQELEESVQAGDIDKDQVRDDVNRAMQRLTSLSKTINTFTSIYESGDTPAHIQLAQACSQAQELLLAKLESCQVKVACEVDPSIYHYASRSDLVDIFIKLFDNTASIAQQRQLGSASLKVTAKVLENNYLELQVEDNAGGVEADILPHIFIPYTTGDFRSEGKGLSLYLLQRMIEDAYHGSINVHNTNDGACFTITMGPYQFEDNRNYLIE